MSRILFTGEWGVGIPACLAGQSRGVGIPACLAGQSWGGLQFLGGSPISGGLRGDPPILGGGEFFFDFCFFWDTPPRPPYQTPEYGQRSAGTHPTGMHSCSKEYTRGVMPCSKVYAIVHLDVGVGAWSQEYPADLKIVRFWKKSLFQRALQYHFNLFDIAMFFVRETWIKSPEWQREMPNKRK